MRRLLLGAVGVVMVAPFFYMISVSFMGEGELLRWPPPLLPASPTTGNYAAGYAFARMRFPGRDGIWNTLLAILAIPAILLLIPRYLMIEALGWVDTYPGLISTELVSVWGIFLMRQTFVMLPRDVEDAARLDGAGDWTLFWRVALPLARPAVAAVAVLAFMDQWRNFLWPLVVTRTARMEVAEVALTRFHTAYAANWPYQMAAAVLVTLPVLLVCLLAQRYVTQGVRFTGAQARL